MMKMKKKETKRGDGEDPRLRYVTQNNLLQNVSPSSVAISTDIIQSVSRVVGYTAHHKATLSSSNCQRGISFIDDRAASALSPFIFEARHNLDWAINSYFLSQLRNEDELRQRFDDNIKAFSLQLLKATKNKVQHTMRERDYKDDGKAVEDEEDQSLFQRLPYDVVWRVFELLDENDLLRIARVSKFFRDIAESNPLWKQLYRVRFNTLRFDSSSTTATTTATTTPCWLSSSKSNGDHHTTSLVPEALYESPPKGFWRELFREKKRRESLRQLRRCNRCHCLGSLVPILYGFPSDFIVSQARMQRAKLGGDHVVLIEKWACLNCDSTFASFPV